MACLRALPVDQILAWVPADDASEGLSWVPVIEGAGGVLPESPEVLLKAGKFNKGEILIGTNKNEYALFQLLPTIFSTDDLRSQLESQFGARASEIMAVYQSIAESDPNQAYVTLMTDVMFRCAARRLARLTQSQGQGVYLYSFDFGSAAHADELLFVFGPEHLAGDVATLLPLWPASLVETTQRFWTNFAYRGDPNGPQLPSWPRYEAASDQHVVLADPPSTGSGLQREACDFWDRSLDAP
jgi:para-nitrobenzyl esterase